MGVGPSPRRLVEALWWPEQGPAAQVSALAPDEEGKARPAQTPAQQRRRVGSKLRSPRAQVWTLTMPPAPPGSGKVTDGGPQAAPGLCAQTLSLGTRSAAPVCLGSLLRLRSIHRAGQALGLREGWDHGPPEATPLPCPLGPLGGQRLPGRQATGVWTKEEGAQDRDLTVGVDQGRPRSHQTVQGPGRPSSEEASRWAPPAWWEAGGTTGPIVPALPLLLGRWTGRPPLLLQWGWWCWRPRRGSEALWEALGLRDKRPPKPQGRGPRQSQVGD